MIAAGGGGKRKRCNMAATRTPEAKDECCNSEYKECRQGGITDDVDFYVILSRQRRPSYAHNSERKRELKEMPLAVPTWGFRSSPLRHH